MTDWYGKPVEEMENSHLHNSLRLMRERCAQALRYVALMDEKDASYNGDDDPHHYQRSRTRAYFDAQVVECDDKAVLLEAEIKSRDDEMNRRRAQSEADKAERAGQQRKMTPAEIDAAFDRQEGK